MTRSPTDATHNKRWVACLSLSAPPHFHAIYAGDEAQITITDGAVLAGALPRTAVKLVREWAELRQVELLEDWRRAQAREELLPIDGLRKPGVVSGLARITQAEAVGGFVLRLTFTDGVVRELDVEPMLGDGVLASLRDPALFAQVEVDAIAGTVSWPNGIDLDPDVLHGDHAPAQGAGPQLLRQRRLRPTG